MIRSLIEQDDQEHGAEHGAQENPDQDGDEEVYEGDPDAPEDS